MLIELKKFFELMTFLSLCLPKEKEAKRKGTSQGRLFVHGSEFQITRGECAPDAAITAADAARRASMRASDFVNVD
ncbi:MAG: hypothetical protein IJR52_10035 [Selenomonadaceae bacterium]|nr:hypothetical protein [Selenomonadaceae bacterium]MBQ9497892.1 hypothetical protein [Selenomonadaceae bacterium]